MRAMTRHGATAVEVMMAGALLVALVVPFYGLLGTSRHASALDEFQVLARRRALRAAALLAGQPYQELLAAATGPAPPQELGEPRLAPFSKEIYLPLPEGGADVTLENLPPAALRAYLAKAATIPTRAFFEEVGIGLGRISVLVAWVDPASREGRHLVVVRFVEDPLPQRSLR